MDVFLSDWGRAGEGQSCQGHLPGEKSKEDKKSNTQKDPEDPWLPTENIQDLHAKRPICQKLLDHNEQIIDTSNAETEDTEYQSTINKMEVSISTQIYSHFDPYSKCPI